MDFSFYCLALFEVSISLENFYSDFVINNKNSCVEAKIRFSCRKFGIIFKIQNLGKNRLTTKLKIKNQKLKDV